MERIFQKKSEDMDRVKRDFWGKVFPTNTKGMKKELEEVERADASQMQYIEIDLTDLDTVVKTIVENEEDNELPTTYVIRKSDRKDQFHLDKKNISESHVLTNLLFHYIKETKFIPKAKTRTSSKDNMSCIESLVLHNGNIIKLYKDLETRQKCAEKLNIPFKDQSMSTISMEHFSRTYPHLRKSTMSHKLLSLLDYEGKPSIFYGKLQDVLFDPETMDAYDIASEKIPHEITNMIIASWALPATYFKKFIDETKDLLGYDDAKFPINSVIGNLGRKENGWKTSIVHRFHKTIHGFDLYQIIDYANCMLYDMSKDLVGGMEKVIAVKTDCIVVRKDDVIENPSILKYRREERLPVIESPISKRRILSVPYVEEIWERKVDLRIKKGEDGAKMLLDTLNGAGCRIQADAGYAENVNGKTIHRGLTIDMTQVARMMRNLPDVILVDEISQIPAYLWNILYAYKMKGYYLETEMVSFICDRNLITLTENHRYINDPSNKMHEIVSAVKNETFDTSDMTLHNVEDVIKAGTINICKTNRMRKHINKLHMDNLRKTTHKASLTLPYCY
ncbi:hypothetical protein HDU87_002894, partial [Geranomyces variabilis]